MQINSTLNIFRLIILVVFLCSNFVFGSEKFPQLSGRWEFNYELTRQSIDDMDAPPDYSGVLVIGTRVDYQFNRRIIDFDNKKLLTVQGYEEPHINIVQQDFFIKKETRAYIIIEVTAVDSKRVFKEKLYRTNGCYYEKNSSGFNEYYCKVE